MHVAECQQIRGPPIAYVTGSGARSAPRQLADATSVRLSIARYSAAVRHHFRLYSDLRRGGGGRRDRYDLCHREPPPCSSSAFILSAFGIGFFCWLMFTLAVYALPFFAASRLGLAAYHSGAGVVGAAVVGFAAGAVTLVVGQIRLCGSRIASAACSDRRSYSRCPPPLPAIMQRWRLPKSACPRLAWREVVRIVGAIFVGGTAFVRMAAMATRPSTRRAGAVAPAQPRIMAATNQR